jgi:hypothetical protein
VNTLPEVSLVNGSMRAVSPGSTARMARSPIDSFSPAA